MRDTRGQLRSTRRYIAEFTGAMLLYTVTLVPSVWWIRLGMGATWILGSLVTELRYR